MNKEHHDKEIYSAEDLARYHNGKMSEKEMHALEKAALEDPFLSDALEGFENQPEQQVSADLLQLRDRLSGRIEGRKRRFAFPVYRVGIAAAVFLLAGSLSLLYFLNKADDQSRDVLVQETQVTRQDTVLRKAQPLKNAEEQKPVSPAGTTTEPVSPAIGDLKINKAQAPGNPTMVDREVKDGAAPGYVQSLPSDATTPKAASAQARIQTPASDATNAQKAAPAPVLMSSTGADPAKNKEANKSVARMMKVRVENTSDTVSPMQNKIAEREEQSSLPAMQEDREMKSMAKKSAITARPFISPYGIASQNAAFSPLGGWQIYDSYLQKAVALKPVFAGKKADLNIVFRIDGSGSPKEIRIDKSGDVIPDAEIIQLLQSGPTWKVNSGADSTVRVRIVF